MCGIAGLICAREERLGDLLAEQMRRLTHRGPDDHGWAVAGHGGLKRGRDKVPEAFAVGLAHRRLSIIDLSASGWQPMSSPDGRYTLVFNGEIYNYIELREELAEGWRFQSTSDTEVLLAAWAAWGVKALERLVGMFAFAVLDLAERQVILVRDFFGIKPLFYCRFKQGIAFASEIKALLPLPSVGRQLDPQAVYEYLRFGATDHGGGTLLKDVFHLPPRHYARVSLDRPDLPEVVAYWKLEPGPARGIGFEEAATELRSLFLRSIRLHLRSDVPVGAALSGGIDSSAVVMAMRRVAPDVSLHTFTYVAEGDLLNEERWADQVIQAARCEPHKTRATAEELRRDLDALIEAQDEPFGSTSIYAQYRVFALAREAGIKVMIDGQGADELLGGYPIFGGARLASLIRHGRWRRAWALYRDLRKYPDGDQAWQHAGRFLLPRGAQDVFRMSLGRRMLPSWLNRSWFAQRDVQPADPYYFKPGGGVLREALSHAAGESNLPKLLRYEDRNSMAHSIESRVPFLTPELARFLLSLPEEFIVADDGTRKSVFRAAMRGLVPDSILDRRDKIGFATPEQKWLIALAPWVERVVQGATNEKLPALRAEALLRHWFEVKAGRARFHSGFWCCLNLIRWMELNGGQLS